MNELIQSLYSFLKGKSQQRQREVRTFEAERTIAAVQDINKKRTLPLVLEIGVGDGTQTHFWRQLGLVFGVEPYPHIGVQYRNLVRSFSEQLPFADKTFPLIITSLVIEHIENKTAAFEEMKRIAVPGALFAHIVPTHVWKILSFYYEFPNQVLRSLGLRPQVFSHAGFVEEKKYRRSWKLIPPVHGVAFSHIAEFREFHPRSWRQLFIMHGFEILYEEGLLLYTSFPSLMPPNRVGARVGLPSTVLFIMRVNDV